MSGEWERRLTWIVVGGSVLALVAVVGINLVVVGRTSDDITDSMSRLEPAQVVIVPGAAVYPDGSLGRPVRQRVEAAVDLYEAGLVSKVLVSGDNSRETYNETDAMRDAVLDAGVPPQDVFTDYAGFSTWYTMRRAARIFEIETAIVVTQGVYAARTVDLGRAAGMRVQGFNIQDGGRRLREWVARLRGFYEATLTPSVTGGKRFAITGDGRASWADDSS